MARFSLRGFKPGGLQTRSLQARGLEEVQTWGWLNFFSFSFFPHHLIIAECGSGSNYCIRRVCALQRIWRNGRIKETHLNAAHLVPRIHHNQ